MNHDSPLYFSWANYRNSSPEAQAEILAEMDLDHCLPDLPWREAAQTFKGAPAPIILKYLPMLAWESQVWIWKNALPTGARSQARPLLSYEAQVALKLRRRNQCWT